MHTLAFYSNVECTDLIQDGGTQFSSNTENKQNVFDNDRDTFWRGSQDGENMPYIGLEWTEGKVVRCLKFYDGDSNTSNKVKIEASDGDGDGDWKEIKKFNKGGWYNVQTSSVPKRIVYVPPPAPPPPDSLGQISSLRWRIVNLDQALE